MNLSTLFCHVWMALYRPYEGGLLRYRDGALHPYQEGT